MIKSYKLVWNPPFDHITVIDGFQTWESANWYNGEYYMSGNGTYNTECTIKSDYEVEFYRDYFGYEYDKST